MLESNRLVFGRAFCVTPVWQWLMQRLSGLFLGPLVAVHMWVPDASTSRILNILLLLSVLGHGYSGMRRLVQSKRMSRMLAVQAWAWLILVAVFGGLIVVYGKSPD